jgi:hypothetical protein
LLRLREAMAEQGREVGKTARKNNLKTIPYRLSVLPAILKLTTTQFFDLKLISLK